MIARLDGTLIEQEADQLIIDVNGVGYEVLATAGVLDKQLSLGSRVTLIVYTDVRETSITLYGFRDKLERQVFLLLQKVKGIGCRLAIGIISAVGAERVLMCIGEGNVQALTKVPGIGKKTAERIILELREQVTQLAHGASLSGSIEKVAYTPTNGKPETSGPNGDAVLALKKLGFTEERANSVVEEVAQQTGVQDAGELLRLALARM